MARSTAVRQPQAASRASSQPQRVRALARMSRAASGASPSTGSGRRSSSSVGSPDGGESPYSSTRPPYPRTIPTMARYGITVPISGRPLHEQREVFERLEDLGYTDLWTGETDAQ